MEGNSKKLISFLMKHEGKDFDAILKDEIEGTVGFSFTSYIKKAKIHIQAGRITFSEPKTGKYFCLPLCGIKQISGETSGQYDIAFTIKYNNDYCIFIQIFDPYYS
ncbi:hypothetical protein ACIFOT_27445 [Neobacillus sp. NRS-1170]|uniref:hypothetical protein n=1 Tax=Neobacillus sp. NRS-1170 TaxID=3233898 RepID=UPI003D29EF5E